MKKNELICARKKTSIGGQALMEGIMMRGPQKSAMAVRRPNGEIYFEEEENQKKKRPAICRWPIIRGIFGFVDSMVLGYKYLMRSADIYMEEPEKAEESEEAVAAEETTETVETAKDATEEKKDAPKSAVGKGTMTVVMIVAVVLGVALAFTLFSWLPSLLYEKVIEPISFWPDDNRYLKSVFEGLIKVVVIVAYMALVSLMKDIHRTFMYHGAEHKTIFCYESGLPLTVENVRAQRRFHPRCGSSFIMLMMLVGIVIGLFIPPTIPGVNETLYTVIRAFIKVLLLPVVMGVGYELLKLAGRHDNILTRIISAPGMWLQRITVREPTDDMIECAIMAFQAVLPPDEEEKKE